MTKQTSAINAAVAATQPNSSPLRRNRHHRHVSLVLALALMAGQVQAAPRCQDLFVKPPSAGLTLLKPVLNVIDALRVLVIPRAPTGPDAVRKAKTGDTVITTFSFANVISFQIAWQQPGSPLHSLIKKALQIEVERMAKEVEEAVIERENLLVTVENASTNPMLTSRGERAKTQIAALETHLRTVRAKASELEKIQTKLNLEQMLSPAELATVQNHKFQLTEKIDGLAARNRALARLNETIASDVVKLEGVAKIGPKGWERLKVLVTRYKKPLMIGGALAVAAGLGGYSWFGNVTTTALGSGATSVGSNSNDQGEEADVSKMIPPEDLVIFSPSEPTADAQPEPPGLFLE